jgi:thiamine pyrophosphokinase
LNFENDSAATMTICADGGANRLYDEIPAMMPHEDADAVRLKYMPHVIAGDLDSVRQDVKEFYIKLGVPVIDLSHDQDSTDLDKAIKFLSDFEQWKEYQSLQKAAEEMALSKKSFDFFIALGAHGGRLDHILSNISSLYSHRDLPVILCGDGNLTRLVQAGKTSIRPNLKLEGPMCGLVPLQGDAVATTTGLRWNLCGTKMNIGGLISTSNVIESDEITVETDVDLIWTTETSVG